MLANALVPLFARPNPGEAGETVAEEGLNIATSHPNQGQWVEVSKQTGTREVSATPNVKVNAVGVGLEIGGVGVNKHQDINKSYLISMHPSLETLEDQPSKLKWLVHSIQPIGSVS